MTRPKFGPVQVDITHHNYGRKQHPKTAFAGKINWIRMQCLGAHGNLKVSRDILRDVMFSRLNVGYQRKFQTIATRLAEISAELKDIADEIADLNGPDKWRTVDTPAPSPPVPIWHRDKSQ